MVVGEAPSEDDNLTGNALMGEPGKLLNRMLTGMGFDPEHVYVTNAVKCHPRGGRSPTEDELTECAQFLEAEIDIIEPKLILALERSAMVALGKPFPERWRGKWFRVGAQRIPALATYHPGYVLRNPDAKLVVGADLRLITNAYAKLLA